MKSTDPLAVRPSDAAAAGCLPRKSWQIEVKSVEDDGTFTIYAAVFGNEDRQGDIIEAGAFDNLDEFVKDGWIASRTIRWRWRWPSPSRPNRTRTG